jgi:hypothetical protein
MAPDTVLGQGADALRVLRDAAREPAFRAVLDAAVTDAPRAYP